MLYSQSFCYALVTFGHYFEHICQAYLIISPYVMRESWLVRRATPAQPHLLARGSQTDPADRARALIYLPAQQS
jgi:hypothetical protein